MRFVPLKDIDQQSILCLHRKVTCFAMCDRK